MLTVILFILKLIGLILLGILGLILLVILLVLFAPFGYDARGSYTKNEGGLARVRVHWLLRAVTVRADWIQKEGKPKIRVKLFAIPIIQLGREKKPKKVKPAKRKSKKRELELEETEKLEVSEESEDIECAISELMKIPSLSESMDIPSTDESTDTFASGDSKVVSLEPVQQMQSESVAEEEGKEKQEKQSILDHLHGLWQKIKNCWQMLLNLEKKFLTIPEKIHNTVEKFCAKIDAVTAKVGSIWKKLHAQRFHEAWVILKRALIRLIHHIRPRRLRGYVHFGLVDQPARMGQILMGLGLLFPLYGEHIEVEPDFTQTVIEGRLSLSGRIRVATVLWLAFRTYRKPVIRGLIKELKNSRNPKSGAGKKAA